MLTNKSSTYLILGGARSGKSHYAETLTQDDPSMDVIYIATATALDDEMQERINHHQKDRPSHWLTIEEPILLAQTLKQHAQENRILLVDCLTLWITNLLTHQNQTLLKIEVKSLLNCISNLPGQVILVSNEVGMGIIPMGELTRRYVDEAGRLHQQLAQKVNTVTLMVAGLPNMIKTPDSL